MTFATFLSSKPFFPREDDTFESPTEKLRAYAQHEKLQRIKECLLANGISKGQRSQGSLLVAETCDRAMGSFKAALMLQLPSSSCSC